MIKQVSIFEALGRLISISCGDRSMTIEEIIRLLDDSETNN
jgi:hypothetical protein